MSPLPTARRISLRISLLYLAFGVVWILLSDITLFTSDLSSYRGYFVSSSKGVLFVSVSAALIFFLLYRSLEKLYRADALTMAIIEHAVEGIMVVDRDGAVLLANEAAQQIAEGSLQEPGNDVVGKLRARAEKVVPVLSSKQTTTFEESWNEDGHERHFQTTLTPFCADAASVSGVVAISHDVTQLKLSQAQLREERDRFENLVKAVPLVICAFERSVDGKFRFPYSSPSIEAIYGTTPDQLALDGSIAIKLIHKDDLQMVMESINVSAQSSNIWNAEYRVMHPTRGELWVEGSSVPVAQSDGSIRWHGYVADVTQRHRDQEQLHLLEQQLFQAQKMESLGQLAGGVAHDFNNILTIIQSSCELMLSDKVEQSTHQTLLGTINEAASRATGITNQLLGFSRMSTASKKSIDLKHQLSNSATLLSKLIRANVNLVLQLPSESVWVLGDETQFDQILLNLISNARDAMPDGGDLVISLRNIRNRGIVELEVSDSGTGMSESVLSQIFDPFFTTKDPGKGTGLGLVVVNEIVRKMQGSIVVDSHLGVGTTFRLTFPTVHPPTDAVVQEPRSIGQGQESILLVEDERAVRTVFQKTLESFGYVVYSAANAAEAIQQMAQHGDQIEVLITDFDMPDMNGQQLASRLRESTSNLRVVFMSGYSQDIALRDGCLEATDMFLQKPFTASCLAQALRRTIDK